MILKLFFSYTYYIYIEKSIYREEFVVVSYQPTAETDCPASKSSVSRQIQYASGLPVALDSKSEARGKDPRYAPSR